MKGRITIKQPDGVKTYIVLLPDGFKAQSLLIQSEGFSSFTIDTNDCAVSRFIPHEVIVKNSDICLFELG